MERFEELAAIFCEENNQSILRELLNKVNDDKIITRVIIHNDKISLINSFFLLK